MKGMTSVVLLLIVFLFLQYLDATITGIGLVLGVWEGNPFATPSGKFVLICTAIPCTLITSRLWWELAVAVLAGLCLLFGGVVVWNLTLLWWWVT